MSGSPHRKGGIDYPTFVRQVLHDYGARVVQDGPRALPDLVALNDELEAVIRATVAGLRTTHGTSWAAIGEVLEVSRQAAQQRWGPGDRAATVARPARDAPAMARRHLTVGINDYPDAPLNGCVPDAEDWHELLRSAGSQGRILRDREATKDAILGELAELVVQARCGDRVVFQYSGHGTWVPDGDGDEADGRDEALVPVDYRDEGLILDDDLYDVLERRRRGVQVLLISDSCHSGTVSRAFGEARAGRPRFLPPAEILPPGQLEAALRVEARPSAGRPRGGGALLSACSDDEVAWDAEFDGRANGAFTRAAIDTFKAAAPTSLTQWLNGTRDRIAHQQTPQLVGSWWQRRRWAPM